MRFTTRSARYLMISAVCLLISTESWGQTRYRFEWPVSVAVDAAGNVYVAEAGRDRIEKFDPAGSSLWRVGRPVQDATPNVFDYDFSSPSGIAVDPAGPIYVADSGNGRVVKLSSDGQWLAAWGWGSGLHQRLNTGRLSRPVAIALDRNNYVYVLDGDTGRVHKFSNTGATYYGYWGGAPGSGDGQFRILAGCCGPFDLAIVSGRNGISAYISDTENHRIHKWAIGADAAGYITSAAFIGWMGLCVSGPNCDGANERSIGFQCTSASCSIPSWGQQAGQRAGQFSHPRGVAVDSVGNLYVADSDNHRIQKFDGGGSQVAMWGSRGDKSGELSTPVDVVTDGTMTVQVADYRNGRVVKFTDNGTQLPYSPQLSVLGGGITVSATRGAPPLLRDSLLDPNPFFIRADTSKTSRIIVTSEALFSGEVELSLRCCVDQLPGSRGTQTGISVNMFPQRLTIPSGGSATADLTIGSVADSGRYVLSVQARTLSGDISRSLSMSFEIIGRLDDDSLAMAPCPVFFDGRELTPEVLHLKQLLDDLYRGKERRQGLGYPMTVGIGSHTAPNIGWVATFEQPTGATPPVQLTEAIVAMQNTTTSMVGMYAISRNSCSSMPVAAVALNPGESGEFRIDSTSATTLVFNLPGRVIAVFAEPNFWTLFGGRKVTFEWVTP